jgi:hypothetical protein
MCQSAQLRKPSTTIQRIQAGEGTTGEDLADLADCNAGEPEQCEWANLVGYKEAIATTIQEAEGDPKCHQPWGSVCAGTHVNCATGQESTVCLHTCLGSLLFDLSGTPFHIYHSPPSLM